LPVIVPVVMTTAKLYTCQFDPAIVAPETGKLNESDGQFVETDFVRFRKSLVTVRSNSYNASKIFLEDWAADRVRTVFVLRPSALGKFLHGFRSFHAPHGDNGLPREYMPPLRLRA